MISFSIYFNRFLKLGSFSAETVLNSHTANIHRTDLRATMSPNKTQHLRRSRRLAGLRPEPTSLPPFRRTQVNCLKDRVRKLKDQLQEFNVMYKCKICLNAPVSKYITPCGHTFCDKCSVKVVKFSICRSAICPICRSDFTEIRSLYFV